MFTEGQLSRDGAIGKAKHGLLGYITKNFDLEGETDIMFVPVGVNYDWVLEADTLTNNVNTNFRGRGAKFVLGSFIRTVAKNLKYVLVNREILLGTACASFGSPISFKSWLAEHDVDFQKLEKLE